MLSNFYPPYERGGYEQLCRDVAEHFVQKGHNVAVLTSKNDDEPSHTITEGVDVYRYLGLSPDYGSRVNPLLQFFLSRHEVEKNNQTHLSQVVSNFQPEIILIWNLQGIPRSIAVEAESFPQIAVAYWLAGYSPAEPDEYWNYWVGPGSHAIARLMRRVLGRRALRQLRSEGKPVRPKLEHVAVVSEFMRNKGVAHGTLPEHTVVIPNGVELDEFYAPIRETNGRLRMLQAGRVSGDKGVHISLGALRKLLTEFKNAEIELTIAGSGPAAYQTQLEEMVHREGLEEHVTFLGWRPRTEMPQIMRSHDVLLLPSIHDEAFARVVLEAMAAGLVVVAATPGGTGEIIKHNQTGLLCPPDDIDAMAAQIRRLQRSPQLRLRLAEAGQRRVMEDYSLENMVDKLEAFLVDAVMNKVAA